MIAGTSLASVSKKLPQLSWNSANEPKPHPLGKSGELILPLVAFNKVNQGLQFIRQINILDLDILGN